MSDLAPASSVSSVSPASSVFVAELAAALGALAPGGVRVGARAIRADDEAALHPVEAAIVASAVAKRRREFATGRALLRSLLATDAPVTVLTSRAPSLPAGVVASLAHDDVVAVAAVSDDPSVSALGVDVERVAAVDPSLADTVCRPEEVGLDPTWVFVAKEALYKAWSTLGGPILRHHDVLLHRIGPEGGGAGDRTDFRGEVVGAVAPADGSLGVRRTFTGRSTVCGGRIVALVVVADHDGPR
ncbi:MAG: 4'-phosphopantetheinyl transferase [Actinomycetes bacterium]|jgi:4'-phosphopantetheinyl transferase EntD|uniref:Unannotated protein n=1 Tax=freshwater metagenome TaxID=449393 RepID=A0A6J6FC45_9ZZZZ|nr:hypothetical protein [Actinomycetota bacterium]